MPSLNAFMLGDRLYPADEASRIRWGRIPRGPLLKVSIVRPRSNPQHDMAWGLISHVTEALRDGPDGLMDADDEGTLTTISLGSGNAHWRHMTPFERRLYPPEPIVAMRRSIRFQNMDGTQFSYWLHGAASFLMMPQFHWLADSRPGRDALNILAKMRAEPPAGLKEQEPKE